MYNPEWKFMNIYDDDYCLIVTINYVDSLEIAFELSKQLYLSRNGV